MIYTSIDPEGALAELYFHLSRQPVFPSRVDFHLQQLAIRTRAQTEVSAESHIAAVANDEQRKG